MAGAAPTPSGIAGRLPSRGRSQREAQSQQERSRLGDQLDEEGSTSPAKAFAQGFAAAATGSLGVGAMQEAMFGRAARAQELRRLQDVDVISQYLQDFRGATPAAAAQEAELIEPLLRSPAKWANRPNAQAFLNEVVGVIDAEGDHGVRNVFALHERLPDRPKREIVDIVHQLRSWPPAAPLRPEIPRNAVQDAMKDLRARYKAPSGLGIRAKVLSRRVMPLAVAALPLSLYGGFDAVRRNRDQKRQEKK